MKKKKKYSKKSTKIKKKRLKIRYDRIFICLILLLLVGYICYFILNKPITNIYIYNNEFLKDQYIIDEAGLRDYPSTLTFSTTSIKTKLEEDPLIKKATIKRLLFRGISITIEENEPLFFYQTENKTVLENNEMVEQKFDVPVLINFVPNKVYKQLVTKMSEINDDVFKRISTIKYDPNDVDSGRFLLSMNDGNYVYLSINKFTDINNYIAIMRKFENKKGILYLDSGEYFKVMEG